MSDPAALSDGQLAALVAAIGAAGTLIAGAVRWGIGRLTKSWDDNGTETRKVIDRNSDVMLENTASNADLAGEQRALAAKIDGLALVVVQREHTGLTPALGTPTMIEDSPTQPLSTVPARPRTPAKGMKVAAGPYSHTFGRAISRGDSDR